VPLIIVGGGSILVGNEVEGVSEMLRPAHAGVANAVGAAVAQIGGQVDEVYDFGQLPRDQAIEQAKEAAAQLAIKAGADAASIEIVEVDVIPLAYLGNAARIRVKATGKLMNL